MLGAVTVGELTVDWHSPSGTGGWTLFIFGCLLVLAGGAFQLKRDELMAKLAAAKQKKDQQGQAVTQGVGGAASVIGPLIELVTFLVKKRMYGVLIILIGLALIAVSVLDVDDAESKLTVTKPNAPVSDGVALVTFKCDGKQTCEGSVALVVSDAQIAAKGLSVTPGGAVDQKFKLNQRGLRLIADGDKSAAVELAGDRIGSVTLLRPATLALATRRTTARRGRVGLGFRCAGHGRCKQTVTLTIPSGRASRARVTIPSSANREVTFTLSQAARQRLRNRGSLKMTAAAGDRRLGTVTVTRSRG